MEYNPNGDTQTAIFGTADASYSSLDVIEDMLNTPAQLDWRLYDSRASGIETATTDNLWLPVDPSELDLAGYPLEL